MKAAVPLDTPAAAPNTKEGPGPGPRWGLCMLSSRSDRRRRLHCLGVALLILGVGNVPWPRADFHNIRHHDGPGETCPLHDHLLGSHPDAGLAEDVAVLHWHWTPPQCPAPADGDTPVVHALAQDWPGVPSDDGLQFAPPEPTGWVDAASVEGPAAPTALAADFPIRLPGPRLDPGALRASPASLSPPISLTILHRHWTC